MTTIPNPTPYNPDDEQEHLPEAMPETFVPTPSPLVEEAREKVRSLHESLGEVYTDREAYQLITSFMADAQNGFVPNMKRLVKRQNFLMNSASTL